MGISICGSNPSGRRDSVTGDLHPVCDCGKPKMLSTTAPTHLGLSVECEMNKFTDMMSYLAVHDDSFDHITAVVNSFGLFNRAWCVAEIAEARSVGMTQRLLIRSKKGVQEHKDKLRAMKVQDMEASRREDVEYILKRISDHEEFNAHLQSLIFDETSGLLSTWVCDAKQLMQNAGQFTKFCVLSDRPDELAQVMMGEYPIV